jgi:hypothetical protein
VVNCEKFRGYVLLVYGNINVLTNMNKHMGVRYLKKSTEI